MAAPWEKYQAAAPETKAGPWSKYQAPAPDAAAPDAGAQMRQNAQAQALERMQLDNPYNFTDTSGGGFWDSAKEAVSGLAQGLLHVPTVSEASPTGTGDAMKDLPASTVQRTTDQALAGNLAGAAGTVAGTGAALAAPLVVERALGSAAPVVAKYGARVRENAPALGAAASKAARTAGPDLARAAVSTVLPYPLGGPAHGVAHLAKTARTLVNEGVYSDLKTAVSDLLTKKTLTELQAANAGRQAVWQKYPDVAAEVEAEAAPAEAPAPAAPVALPSGRTPGGIQNQVNEAPAPAPPRRAPLWQQLPASETPAPVAPAEAAAPVALPSGRKPGGIQNQTAAPVLPEPTTPDTVSTESGPGLVPAADSNGKPTEPLVFSAEAEEALAHAREHDHPSVIAHIESTGQAPAPGILRVLQHGDNKAGVFARYIQDQAIDPARVQQVETSTALVDQFKQQAELPGKATIKQIRAAAEKHGRLDIVDAVEQVQGFADEAHAFATAHEMPAGKEYQLISPGTWELVRQRFGATPGEPYMGAAAKLVPSAPATPARRLLVEPNPTEALENPTEALEDPTPRAETSEIDRRSGAQKEADALLANAKAEAARIVAEARQRASFPPEANSQTPATLPAWEDEPQSNPLRADAGRDEGGSRALSRSDRTSEAVASESPSRTVVKVPGSSHGYQARYEVRELSDVQPSHNGHNFEPNPKYAIKNDRNYQNAVNQAKIVNWSSAAEFDPSYHITDTPDALNGPVVIDSEGNVLGANGRTMILQRVYKNNPKGAAAYRELLAKKAANFGVDPAQVRTMKEPVLTRVVDDAEFEPGSGRTKANAVTDFNVKGTADLTPAERAIADSRRVSERTLSNVAERLEAKGSDATLADILDGKGGVEVLNHLVEDGVVAPQERAAFATEDALTKAGKERVASLMLGRFFRDPAQLDTLAASIRQKVERLAAPLAQVEAMGHDWNLTPHLQDALELIDRMRASGTKNLADFLKQDGLFGTAQYTPAAQRLAGALLEKTQREMTAAARQYADDASFGAKGESLFGEPPKPAEAFEAAFGKGELPTPPTPAPEPVAVKKQSGAEREAAAVMAKAKAGAGKTSAAPTTPTKSAQAIADAPAKADNASMPGEYPRAGAKVDGLTVREDVPNMGSIASTLDNYEVLPGIREVPMSAFEAPNTYYSASDHARVNKLAREISESGELNPLIVVLDEKGAYVLEGGHRLAALDRLKKKSLPAKVVIDRDAVPAAPEPEPPAPAKAAPKRTPKARGLKDLGK